MQTPVRERNEQGLDSHARLILLGKKQINQATWTHTRSKKRLDRNRRPFRFGPYRAGDKVPGIQEHAMGAKAERGHLRLEWVRQTVARLVKNMGACIQEGHSLCINRATTRQDSVGYVVQGLGKE